MNSLSGKTSLLATGGMNAARLSSIQRIRWTGSSSAMTGPLPQGSVYDGGRAPERPSELAEPAVGNRGAGQTVRARPAPVGEIGGAEQSVDDRQMNGEVLVDRLGLHRVVPVMEARRDDESLDRAETEPHVGVDEHRVERHED